MHRTSRADLEKLWEDLGVEPGHLAMCHSFLPSLGAVEGGPSAVLETLVERVGPRGHVVVPAFTYSIFENEVFDPAETPSTVGALGDLARAFPGAVRSLDPAFSMVAIGPDAARLMERRSANSFGPGSIYAGLVEAGMHTLLLGVDFTAMSLFMHLERELGVAYRYDKTFHGKTRTPQGEVDDELVHFVRDLDGDWENDRTEIGKVLEADERCRIVRYGYSDHRYMSAAAIAEVVARELAANPYALVRYPAARS